MEVKDRLNIVNELVKIIADSGRKFFAPKNNLYEILHFIIDESSELCVYNPNTGKYINISRTRKSLDRTLDRTLTYGSTLRGLILDFRKFILNGEYTNGDHGRSGVFCSHWGYNHDDMVKIRRKAFDLGYIPSYIEPTNCSDWL